MWKQQPFPAQIMINKGHTQRYVWSTFGSNGNQLRGNSLWKWYKFGRVHWLLTTAKEISDISF